MKSLLIISALSLVGSCTTTKYSTKIDNLQSSIVVTDSATVSKYANTITAEEVKTQIFEVASDTFNGREVGTKGQKLAANYIKDFYIKENILSANDSSYFQHIPKSFLPKKYNASENVVAYIKGEENPEELLIISGHFDHLGVSHGEVNYGADDNGSGTVAMLQIAQAFKKAERDGISPKRSILFLHLTAEEIGLQGSLYYTQNPLFPLENTIADLNIDMIGRVDEKHKDNPDYIYLIGADRISKELHFISEKVNSTSTNIELDYKFNEKDDPNRYYFRSDHYNFAQEGIPVIFYFNGTHADYHKPSDTPDKINYKLLTKRAQLIFSTAWYLANKEGDLIHNEDI
ncbi:M28 family peptidase [Mesoflavibacter sp. CH_XMU1404-2]|uniref:M28 family peptidase n=1 Tax=Mesoflavibacter sp. CH_XMU1404-2 TaxID=3107766 RepID=UPI0030082425